MSEHIFGSRLAPAGLRWGSGSDGTGVSRDNKLTSTLISFNSRHFLEGIVYQAIFESLILAFDSFYKLIIKDK